MSCRLGSLILLAALASSSCGRPAPGPRRASALPQTSGVLVVSGISQPVRIVRDRWGIPHVSAETQHDLFFAQGFVQAQDRLFQMDLWRRSVQGRLSQVLGPNFIDRDAMTRRMQYRGGPDVEWASYGPETKAIAQAFVTGINAWIARAREDLPEEFVLAGWKPELWIPEDLLNRTDAFLASGDAASEAFRAQLAGAVGEKRAAALMPGALPRGLPKDIDVQKAGEVLNDALRRVGTTPFFLSFGVRPKPDPTGASSGGSNAWALAASRSATGSPLLASDPHRPLTSPSLRYLVHLQAPGWNVIGATSPWLPGVVMGHNDRVAWGMAAYPGDSQDLYVEPVSAIVERIKDPITVKGYGKPVAFEKEYTRNGVVIASDRAHGLVFTLKWSGFEPGGAGELGALALDRAAGASELRDAVVRWKLPVVDVVYADDSGVGRQVSGASAPSTSSAVVIAANESPARTGRLRELLGGARKFSVGEVKMQQHDVTSWNAEQLVPRLQGLRSKDPRVEDLRQRLLKWDRRMAGGSDAAAVYAAFERALWRRISEARVPATLLNDYLGLTELNLADAMNAGSATLLEALSIAGQQAKPQLPQVTFRHPLAITQATRRTLNVGPFAVGGDAGTVMSVASRSNLEIGASFRQIIDVADWDASVATNAPGQSQWPRSLHFADLSTLWAAGEYFPLVFSEKSIQNNAESTLTLQPR